MKINSVFIGLSIFSASVYGQGLIDVLISNGFTSFATNLQANPALMAKFTDRNDITIYAPTNAAVNLRKRQLQRRQSENEISCQAIHTGPPPSGQDFFSRKRQAQLPPSNFVTLRTFMDDPGVVNLGPGQPFRVVQNYAAPPPGSSLATIQVTSGAGQVTNQIAGPFKYDKGLIYGVNGFFTLPRPLIETLDTVGLTTFSQAVKTANLETFLSTRPGVTIFAPVNSPEFTGNINVLEHSISTRFLFLPELFYNSPLRSDVGTVLKITFDNGSFFVNGIRIIKSDISITNGVVHSIERPLSSAASQPPPNGSLPPPANAADSNPPSTVTSPMPADMKTTTTTCASANTPTYRPRGRGRA